MTKKPTYEELEKRVTILEQSELEYKQAVEALRKNEIQNQLLADNVSDMIWTMDMEQRLTYFSPSIYRFRGYTPEEALQIPIENSLTPESYEKAVSVMTEEFAAEGKPGVAPDRSRTLELEHIRKDGNTIWGEVTTSFIRNEEGLPSGIIGITRDITERKQIETKLHKEINFSQTLIHASPAFYVAINSEGKTIMVNETMLHSLGYKQEEVVGKNYMTTFIPKKYRKELSGIFNKLVKVNIPTLNENYILTKDGKKLLVEWHGRPVFNEKNEFDYFLGVGIDITKRKHAEEALRESEKKYRLIFNNAPMGILHFNENGIIASCNDKFVEIIGSSREKLIGLNMLNHPDDHVVSSVKQSLGGKPAYYEGDYHSVTAKKVTQTRMLFEPIVSQDKSVSGGVGIIENITERKQAEEALRESKERYRQLFNIAPAGIYEINFRTGKIVSVNDAVCDYTGYTKDELLSMNAIDLLTEKSKKTFLNRMDKILNGENTNSYVEHEITKKDGNVFWASINNRYLYDGENIIGTTVVAQDITQQKKIEAQLRQAQKMESIGTLAGGIAHDFNNLLYMITGNAELALDDIPEWHPVHDNLKEIKTAGMRAAGIVKQLLSFSRKIDQELKPIGAITIIKDALKFLRSMIPSTIQINTHLPDTDISILADPVQINQVLMNTCTNASQAMEETGGILEVNVEITSLTQDAANHYPDFSAGEYVKIAVTDNGPGIDSKIIDRIFDPYFTTKEVGKGSGMGLAIVIGIIKNHGGAITVDSQPGKGATFTMLFPVVKKKPEIKTATTEELLLGNGTILFVDDDEAIVNMTGQMLERLGYTVETKTNPSAALELFQSKPDAFDLVITDMTMPHMTGARLSEKLKNIRSDIPVIICTGHSPLIDEEKAKKMGIAAYVMKPIVIRDIARTIRQVLGN